MYDAGKVIIGLAIFVAIFTSPIWINLSVGQEVREPDLSPALAASKDGGCIEDTEFMREKHMDLLNDWRNEVVRDHDRFYTRDGHEVMWSELAKEPEKFALYGDEKVQKSLSNTCMKCHSNYTDFCNACHTNSGVDPFCWDCHLNFSEGVK